jgi:hypothetical protein
LSGVVVPFTSVITMIVGFSPANLFTHPGLLEAVSKFLASCDLTIFETPSTRIVLNFTSIDSNSLA